MSHSGRNSGLMERVAAFIVDKRRWFFLAYIAALVFCVFSMGWVSVENDITQYLDEDTETRRGIEAMNANFSPLATGRVMVTNVSLDTAWQLYDQLSAVEGVNMVTFDDSDEHYRSSCALYDVTFDGGNFDQVSMDAMATIRQLLSRYDTYIDSQLGYDMNDMLRDEMAVILVVAVIIIFGVLILTSRSFMEVPVLLLNFGAAALLNMGTNFIFDKISFISDSVAVVLQLALAIDYAIILCHRFSDEHENKNARDAAVAALSKAIPEISASSLTTISGLMALAFMQFGIGKDMAFVLIKAIFLSLMTVFTLMPGLLVLFSRLIDKTRHKKLIPDVSWLGRFAVKVRRVLPPIFALVLVAGFLLSSRCPYCYSFTDLKTAKMTEQQHSYFKIKDVFGTSNMVALLVPAGDYEAEGAILRELETRPEVKGTMGLSNIEAMEGHMLTEAVTPRQLSEFLSMDYEIVEGLYSLYAVENEQLGKLIDGIAEYRVPLFDIFIFLKDTLEQNNISLDGDRGEGMDDAGAMLEQLETARQQMKNDRYSRMVIYLNLPEESEETYAFLQEIRNICAKYYDGDYYLVGNSTSSRDLAASFSRDNMIISTLSIVFVVLVLLFTFRSIGLPLLLIVVIQGSIWINFSYPTLVGQPLFFLGYLIVQALQMGANIDYAIVISSHYQEEKKHMSHKKAIVAAVNSSFATVFTSGTIMSSAGLLIGNLSAQPVVAIMGMCIGRGTIVSMVLVLFVLPSILVLGDSIIERTRINIRPVADTGIETEGSVRVRGRVRGQVSGWVDGSFDGVIHGQVSLALASDSMVEEEAEEIEYDEY